MNVIFKKNTDFCHFLKVSKWFHRHYKSFLLKAIFFNDILLHKIHLLELVIVIDWMGEIFEINGFNCIKYLNYINYLSCISPRGKKENLVNKNLNFPCDVYRYDYKRAKKSFISGTFAL